MAEALLEMAVLMVGSFLQSMLTEMPVRRPAYAMVTVPAGPLPPARTKS